MAYLLDDEIIYGHNSTIAEFEKAVSLGRFHHAWLLFGIKGIGKAKVASELAAKLLKANKNNQRDLIKSKSHPDLFVLEAESNDEVPLHNEIKVEQVRKLINFLHLTPVLAERKVVLIDSINAFNTNSSNALLKVLEEPPGKATFLIICHSLHSIAPTIRSRCAILRFKPLSKHDFTKILSHKHIDIDPDFAFKVSSGSMHLIKFFSQPLFRNLITEIEEFVKNESKISAENLLGLKNKLSNVDLWFCFAYFIQKFQVDKMKQLISEGKKVDNLIEWFQKTNKLLKDKNIFNLDASNVALAILCQKQ